jgi:hypothetical protein
MILSDPLPFDLSVSPISIAVQERAAGWRGFFDLRVDA